MKDFGERFTDHIYRRNAWQGMGKHQARLLKGQQDQLSVGHGWCRPLTALWTML